MPCSGLALIPLENKTDFPHLGSSGVTVKVRVTMDDARYPSKQHDISQAFVTTPSDLFSKAPVTPDRTILWSYDWLRFGQLRPIGNVCCDLLLQSHALIGFMSYVNLHDNLCIYTFWPAVGKFIVNNLSKWGVDNAWHVTK